MTQPTTVSRWLRRFLLLALLTLLSVPPMLRAEEEAKLPKPEKLILGEMVGEFGTQGMKWQENWKANNAATMTAAAQRALKVATHPEMTRTRLRAEIEHGGAAVKKAPRNLDVGRHDLVKFLLARACERANQRLAADKLTPLARATTVNSGGTGDFTRDVDVTIFGGDEVREQYLFEAIIAEAEAMEPKLKYEIDPKLGVKAGINFPQIEVAMHRGNNDLPDARFASDVQIFAANYRRVIESQAKNPEAYFGYGFEVEVQGRRSLSFKPGQTLVQEFICEPGKPVQYEGKIAACQKEVRGMLSGAIGQRYRRAQNASHITNHYLQAFRHEQGPDHDLSKGALKYAGRTIEALCEYHGMKNWPELMPADRMVVLKSLFPRGYGDTPGEQKILERMSKSIDVAYLTFIGKATPEKSGSWSLIGAEFDAEGKQKKRPMETAEVQEHAEVAMIFMRKAAAVTASAAAQEMLTPPPFDPRFLAEVAGKAGQNWDLMNATERAKFAMEADSNYKKCCSVAAMENLMCIVQQVRQLDLPEYNNKGTKPGRDALQQMLDSANDRTRPILELAIDHAEAAVQLDTAKDPVRRALAAEKLKGYRKQLQQLTGVPGAGEAVIDKASKTSADEYVASTKSRKASPLGEGYAELKSRFYEHIEEAFPPTDLAGFRAHVREVGVKSYVLNKMVHEIASPATALDIISLIEIYQNGGGKAELGKAAGISLVNRGHWALGFLIQAAEVKSEKDLCELGKNVVFDALSRLVPAAGTFKIAFDIEKGLVNITVGYTINRLNSDLIDALYTGEAGRLNDGTAGKVAGQLRDSGFCVLDAAHVTKDTDEKTKKVSIVINQPAMYVSYFKRFTGRDYDDRTTPIGEKKAAHLVKYHDGLIRLLQNQAACQEPAWFGESKAIKPTPEELNQAMADYYKALELHTRPIVQGVLAESGVRQYIQDGKDVIEEGLVARFTQDLLLGTTAVWQTQQIERNEARRDVEATANFADMNQIATAVQKSFIPTASGKPGYTIEVRLAGQPLPDVIDGDEPIRFQFVLHCSGDAPPDVPSVAFEVDQGPLSPPADGKAYKPHEQVKQSFKVSAVTDGGVMLAETGFNVTVILPEKTEGPTLLEYVGKDEDGRIWTRYTYYEAAAFKNPKYKPSVPVKVDGSKVYHGKFTEYDSKGREKRITQYKYGYKDGVMTSYDTGGDATGAEKRWLSAETTFSMDKQVKHLCNYPDGSKNWEMEYDGEEQIISQTTYWGEGAAVMERSTYQNQSGAAGRKEGTYIAKWKDGSPRISSSFRNAGVGALITRDNIESCRNGPWERNYKGGKPAERGQTRDAVLVGKWEYANEKGNPTADVTYDDKGKVIEQKKWEYWDNDKLKEVTHNIEGLATGEWIKNYENGALQEKKNYVNDKLHGPYVEAAENGVVTAQGKYVDGEKDGPWITRSKDNQLLTEMNYSNGKLHGSCINYHGNGKVSSKNEYKDGVPSGKYELHHEDGSFEETGAYLDGKKEGLWVYYDKKGKRSSWEEYKKGDRIKSGAYKDEKK